MIRKSIKAGRTYSSDILTVSIPKNVANKAVASMGVYFDLVAEELGVSKLEAQTILLNKKRNLAHI